MSKKLLLQSVIVFLFTFSVTGLLLSYLWQIVVDIPIQKETLRRDHSAVYALLSDDIRNAYMSGQCTELTANIVRGFQGLRLKIHENGKTSCDTHPKSIGWLADAQYLPMRIDGKGTAELYHVPLLPFYEQARNDLISVLTMQRAEKHQTWRSRFLFVSVLALSLMAALAWYFYSSRKRNLYLTLAAIEENREEVSRTRIERDQLLKKQSSIIGKTGKLEDLLGQKEKELEEARDDLLINILSKDTEIEDHKENYVRLQSEVHRIGESKSAKEKELESEVAKLTGDLDTLDHRIQELNADANELNELKAENLNREQLHTEYTQYVNRLEEVKSLWSRKPSEWKQRQTIEEEMSPDYLPFTTFSAMISIERKLREQTGHLSDRDVRSTDLINNNNVPQGTRLRLESAFALRNKWFHGSSKPGHLSDYKRIIKLADEIDADIF